MNRQNVINLRRIINENIRVQRGGVDPVKYIDPANFLGDITARQNHAVFGRRGCGKTLLLHQSVKYLPETIKVIYLNCEDFKKHSFPNVLIEILDALFFEIERNLSAWFGRKRKLREIITNIRKKFNELRSKEDDSEQEIRQAESLQQDESCTAKLEVKVQNVSAGVGGSSAEQKRIDIERKYKINESKIKDLDIWLPELKRYIREFFELSTNVQAIFIQIDDYYHLPRTDQPFIMDYIHRLCKDVPLFFKVATLRHASTLFSDSVTQPIGAQERHDYQPINVDYSFADFRRTVQQNKNILLEFGALAGINHSEINDLFKGEGFERLILAGGGVPRDCLSLFLEVLEAVKSQSDEGRIGKDDVRILSRTNFERRIEELKQDSDIEDQGALLRGIYVIRQFCIDKKSNIMLVPESLLQRNDNIRNLLYRLLDYRIIHSSGGALTHKTQSGTYHAFAVDIGCYAYMRVLHGKFNEIDLADVNSKDKMRSAPVLDEKYFDSLWAKAPTNPEDALQSQGDS